MKRHLPGFADRLREARLAFGIAQSDAAARIDVHINTYGLWELGRNEPSIALLPVICDVLDVDVEWLLGMKA